MHEIQSGETSPEPSNTNDPKLRFVTTPGGLVNVDPSDSRTIADIPLFEIAEGLRKLGLGRKERRRLLAKAKREGAR